MIQLCFGDSVKGTLTCAPHIGNTIGGATAVVISTDKPLDTPLQKAAFAVYRTLATPFYKRRAQKQEARRRAEAVPVDYESNDVIALLGDLNEGPIAGDLMSEARKEVVRAWLCFSPHGDTAGTDADVEPYWQACQKDLQTLLTRAHTGEPVRIWYDHTPASLCGLHKRTEYRIHEHLPVKSLVELCIFIMKFLKLALLPAKYLYNFHPRKMLGQKCIDVRQARTV